jgi:uncharacterized metal-binding protein YceD (DUF177 family)
MMSNGSAPVEFSRILPLDAVGSDGRAPRKVTASPEECEALKQRLGLQGLANFSAEMTIDWIGADEIYVRGRVVADVVQTCVVTLDPVPAHVEDAFEAQFTTRLEEEPVDRIVGPDDEDPPEALTEGELDMGELATQQLALALEPWPRLPDAEIPDAFAADPSRDGPFAVLAALRDKGRNGAG